MIPEPVKEEVSSPEIEIPTYEPPKTEAYEPPKTQEDEGQKRTRASIDSQEIYKVSAERVVLEPKKEIFTEQIKPKSEMPKREPETPTEPEVLKNEASSKFEKEKEKAQKQKEEKRKEEERKERNREEKKQEKKEEPKSEKKEEKSSSLWDRLKTGAAILTTYIFQKAYELNNPPQKSKVYAKERSGFRSITGPPLVSFPSPSEGGEDEPSQKDEDMSESKKDEIEHVETTNLQATVQAPPGSGGPEIKPIQELSLEDEGPKIGPDLEKVGGLSKGNRRLPGGLGRISSIKKGYLGPNIIKPGKSVLSKKKGPVASKKGFSKLTPARSWSDGGAGGGGGAIQEEFLAEDGAEGGPVPRWLLPLFVAIGVFIIWYILKVMAFL